MCVAATCRRRRAQMRLDKRYKKRNLEVAARRQAAMVAAEKQRTARSKKK